MLFVPINPPNDPAECQPWLFESLKRLNLAASRSSQGFSAIIRNEAPDGSGNVLIDTTPFFVKPGLITGQIAFGGLNANENLTLSSTKNSNKGFIYLGEAQTSGFDEDNQFLGIGTPTPDGLLHLHLVLPGTPAIGSFGNEFMEMTTIISAAETEMLKVTTWQNNGGAYDLAVITAGSAASRSIYFTSATIAVGLRLAFGTYGGGDTMNSAHLQFGGLNSGGTAVNVNGSICGINDTTGNSFRSLFNYFTFETGAGVFTNLARVGVNTDPFDFSSSAAGSQPDSLHVARRTGATAGVPTVLIEGTTSTQAALAIRAASTGTTPTKIINANTLGGFRHDGDLILTNAGTLRGLLNGASGGTTEGFKFVVTADSLNILSGGRQTGWSDTLVSNSFLIAGDVASTHRALFVTSSGFAIFTRLGFSSAYTLFSNGGAGGASSSFPAPEATPSVVRIVNTSASGADGAIVLKVESQRAGQSGRLISLVGSGGEVAGMTAAGNYFLLSGAGTGKVLADSGSGVGAWSNASALATRVQQRWAANGAYRVDTSVDGTYVAPTAMTLTSVRLWRGTAGTSGSTTVDLKKNGVTMLSVQPTITAASGNDQTALGTLSVTSVAVGDKLTIDATAVEVGTPRDYTLIIEGA
jgi:hypothetical protein